MMLLCLAQAATSKQKQDIRKNGLAGGCCSLQSARILLWMFTSSQSLTGHWRSEWLGDEISASAKSSGPSYRGDSRSRRGAVCSQWLVPQCGESGRHNLNQPQLDQWIQYHVVGNTSNKDFLQSLGFAGRLQVRPFWMQHLPGRAPSFHSRVSCLMCV
jgi:hypothetical protein